MMLRNIALSARFFFLALGVVALLAGCDSTSNDNGKEADLVSENPSKKTELPKGSGPLWSLTPGQSWRTLTRRPNQKNVDSEIRVVGEYRVPDGRTGTVVRSYRGGVPFRVEIYQMNSSGSMKLLALGESEQKLLVFSPAIPFLKTPIKEGESLQWSGLAKMGKQEYAATAFHRISAIDDVKDVFDNSIRAYRLDGIVSLNSGAQRIDYPVVMWFVPGKGIAQRRLADRGQLALEQITKFSK